VDRYAPMILYFLNDLHPLMIIKKILMLEIVINIIIAKFILSGFLLNGLIDHTAIIRHSTIAGA